MIRAEDKNVYLSHKIRVVIGLFKTLKIMGNNKASSFIFGIIAIILGCVLFKQFDFNTLKFEHKGLAFIYGITFILSINILMRNYKNNREK